MDRSLKYSIPFEHTRIAGRRPDKRRDSSVNSSVDSRVDSRVSRRWMLDTEAPFFYNVRHFKARSHPARIISTASRRWITRLVGQGRIAPGERWRRREKSNWIEDMYLYQKNRQFFAQIADGIKERGARELSELGARKVRPAYGGVYFTADMETLYRANYCARLASRILAPLASFDCRNADQLYRKAKQIRWTDFLSVDDTFAIYGNVSNSGINNSHYASLRLKDGIVDWFREKLGKRPNVDARNPDAWLNIYIRHDKAVLSLDASGGSLHRRGYRKDSVAAPMQETVAAAIIGYTKWNGSAPLYDPMCGSGTLLAEALMHFCRIPSGFLRKRFGFEHLPDFKRSRWVQVRKEQDRRIRSLPEGCIAGGDASPKAVNISRNNLKKLRDGEKIRIRTLDFRSFEGVENGVIVTNPPYGIRVGRDEDLDLLYKSLGDFLKQKCKGSTAYIYFGERLFIKKVGLKTAWKKPLKAGGLDGRLVKYELY